MIQLIHGNALKVIPTLSGKFDAIITDPPYASGAATKGGREQSTAKKYTSTKQRCPLPDFEGDAMDQRSWTHLMSEVLSEVRKICNPGAVLAMFIDWRQLPALTDAIQWAGWIWRGTAAWDKGNCRPQKGRFRQQAEFIVWGSNGALPIDRPVPALPGVYQCPVVSAADRYHQTEKPLELMQQIIRLCVPGGNILDPFAGSGTTLEAARLGGYDATGIELSEEIYGIAKRRLAQ